MVHSELDLAGLPCFGVPAPAVGGWFFLGKEGASFLTLSFSLDRLDINTNTYTSQDLKSALAKFKEGAEVESSKEDKVCDTLSRELVSLPDSLERNHFLLEAIKITWGYDNNIVK